MPAAILNYYVLPGLSVVACEYPHAPDDPGLARAKRRVLQDLGVTYVLDLTTPGELHPWAPDDDWHPARERFAIPDVSVPDSLAAFSRQIGVMAARLRAGATVAVHCWGGVGRTGTVTAALLVYHGWPVEDALAEVNRLWRASPKASLAPHKQRTAPETEEQRDFVRVWAAAETCGRK